MSQNLEVVGGTRRCLNLGSYNYLGFAAADEYCTPRVLDTMAEWGVSTCSSRTEGGGAQAEGSFDQTASQSINQPVKPAQDSQLLKQLLYSST